MFDNRRHVHYSEYMERGATILHDFETSDFSTLAYTSPPTFTGTVPLNFGCRREGTKIGTTMRRSEQTHESDFEWKGNIGNHWKMKTPKSTAGPRLVAIDDTWQGSINSVPKPTYWTPDESDQKSRRVDETPCPLQSPAFIVHNDDDGDIRSLKARMDRQEDLMEKMMHEITSLRRELTGKTSNMTEPGKIGMKENLTQDGLDPGTVFGKKDAREGVPFAATQVNQGRDYMESARSFEPVEIHPKRVLVESPGAKFVAEFSEIFELDIGQHALLASIIDQSVCHNQRDKCRNNKF